MILSFFFAFLAAQECSTRPLRSPFNLQVGYKSRLTMTVPSPKEPMKGLVQLPIVQLFDEGELQLEIVFGKSVMESIAKLTSVLKLRCCEQSVSKSNDGASSNSGRVDTVYSDSMLNDYISSNRPTILKLYRTHCRQCALMELSFLQLAGIYQEQYHWVQASLDNVPEYLQLTRHRLSGKRGNNKENSLGIPVDCVRCGNTGFVLCSKCLGSGQTRRGSMTLSCPICVGHGKIRCDACGGMCVHCSV